MREAPPRARSGAAARLGLAETDGALILRSAILRSVMGAVWSGGSLLSGGQQAAHELEVVGSIDFDGDRVNDGRVDAHAVLERPKLLQLLALFQRRRLQRDEALERGA